MADSALIYHARSPTIIPEDSGSILVGTKIFTLFSEKASNLPRVSLDSRNTFQKIHRSETALKKL